MKPKESAGPPDAANAAAEAEESLNEALDDLEHILEERRPSRGAGPPQSIPLLDDVVVPGAGPPPAMAPSSHGTLAHEEYAELCRRIAARLASEMEIIVNDRLEKAIQDALGEAQRSIRNHLDIVLPEIVEELRQSTPADDQDTPWDTPPSD